MFFLKRPFWFITTSKQYQWSLDSDITGFGTHVLALNESIGEVEEGDRYKQIKQSVR